MKRVFLCVVAVLLLSAGMAAAEGAVEISGDYRFRYDHLEGTVHDYVQFDGVTPAGQPVPGFDVKNNSLLTNRFGVNLAVEALEDVRVKARLVMFKVWGHQTADPFLGTFFADRFQAFGVHDGISGHVPEDNKIVADYAYATVSNVFDQPVWVSVGRRPTTGGIPSTLRLNKEKMGTAGIPNLLVDYAFDGGTIGWAPDIEALPGAYVKFCAGRGFDSGFRPGTGAGKDTDFYGLNVVPFDTQTLHVEIQYQIGKNIFDTPADAPSLTGTPDRGPTTNVGDIAWWGGVIMGKVGSLNLFASGAASMTDPNDNTNPFGAGLLWDQVNPREDRTGYAAYVGARYDLPTGTKIGAEYNHGSKYWIGMVPASDDVWTAKLGTRGDVFEVYVIQELKRAAITKKGRAYVRLGLQHYEFEFTGSNNWIGAPVEIASLNTADPTKQQFLAPLEDADDIYFTFDVEF
jgi:hypothetical protein